MRGIRLNGHGPGGDILAVAKATLIVKASTERCGGGCEDGREESQAGEDVRFHNSIFRV